VLYVTVWVNGNKEIYHGENTPDVNLPIMKNPYRLARITLFGVTLLAGMNSCSREDTTPSATAVNNPYSSQISALPRETPDADESHSLAFMREEEKLARDVYQYLYSVWQVKIFNNIASSEQTHMDAVLLLLDKYGLPDPAAGMSTGVFKNAVLQDLYKQLISQGQKSALDAYIIGATIEDLDLRDLYDALEKVDNQDIIYVYENLARGSRNHLRSFYRNILNAGGTYKPQYISQDEFDLIVNGPMETGN
jgi:hypothetical protein